MISACRTLFVLLLVLGTLATASPAQPPTGVSLSPIWTSCAGHTGQEPILDFSPDGKSALFAGTPAGLIVRDTKTWVKTTAPLSAWPYHGTYAIIRDARFAPDGKHAVAFA